MSEKAESCYLLLLNSELASVRSLARRRLRELLIEREKEGVSDQFSWLPIPFRPLLVTLQSWRWRPEFIWLSVLFSLALLSKWTQRRGRGQLRIERFKRDLPAAIALGPEETIADYHRKTQELGRPLGVLLTPGLKLPVVSNAPSETLADLLEIAKSPSWLTEAIRFIVKLSDRPRFVISGHIEGNAACVRLVVMLYDCGAVIGTWDVTTVVNDLLDKQAILACEVIRKLSEHPI